MRSVLPALATFLTASTAFAAADVRVTIPAPAATHVYDPVAYGIQVANIGNKTASAVAVDITLPRTHTSPGVHVMGQLSGIDPRCSQSGTHLLCSLGNLARNTSTTVAFQIALPEADEVLSISAVASSSSNENSLANNSAGNTPSLLHYDIPLTGGELMTAEHCTGTSLTSYYECTLFPSSISSFDFELVVGGTVEIDSEPDFGGTWSQTPPGAQQSDPEYLALEFTYAGDVVAEFEGWGSNDAPECFEGMTTFPGSSYVSPYRVCL